jgi:3-dehydroquinate dehydratase-1
LAPNLPKICVALVSDDLDIITELSPLADMFEVRIDLIGPGWRQVVSRLKKPWIASARRKDEGGKWGGKETERIKALQNAAGLGAAIVDVELATPALGDLVDDIKKKAKCLISYHNLKNTPPLDDLRKVVNRQLAVGADICKVVTTARDFNDNLTVLKLIAEFSSTRNIVSFAMGAKGRFSRVLSPLAGGYFTYASVGQGKESAEGQITIKGLREIYRILSHGK